MKILFYQWHSFMNKGMERALQQLRIEYDVFFYQQTDWENDEEFAGKVKAAVLAGAGNGKTYDAVLSVNFAPLVSNVCEELGVRYVSWIYDSPIHIRNLAPMKNSCNSIYIFDRGLVEEYQKMGIAAQHMPLAVDPWVFADEGLAHKADSGARIAPAEKYQAQVSLLGNLYQTEYRAVASPLDQYEQGYLEGIISAQSKVYGGYLIPELVTEDLIARMNEQYAAAGAKNFQIERRQLEWLLAREVTGRERYVIAALLSNHFDFALYSSQKDERLKNARMHDYVHYYRDMPQVFASSRVNLNITLKTIRTGIPLRVVDVLGCGGFLISNYQEELTEHFVAGQELEVYENLEDLYAKVKFYLERAECRSRIAVIGLEKVKRDFTFKERLEKMLL